MRNHREGRTLGYYCSCNSCCEMTSDVEKKCTAVILAVHTRLTFMARHFGGAVLSGGAPPRGGTVTLWSSPPSGERLLRRCAEAFPLLPWRLINTCQYLSEWAGLAWLIRVVSRSACTHKQRLCLCSLCSPTHTHSYCFPTCLHASLNISLHRRPTQM